MIIKFKTTDNNYLDKIRNSLEFKSFKNTFDNDLKRIVEEQIQYRIHSHIWTDEQGLLDYFIMQLNSLFLTIGGINPLGKGLKNIENKNKNEIINKDGIRFTAYTLETPIKYYIDERDETNYSFLQNKLSLATTEWQNALINKKIKLFEFTNDINASVFIVKIALLFKGKAESFFPSNYIQGQKSTLTIDSEFFNLSKNENIFHGVLLHELGHILGFEHEYDLAKAKREPQKPVKKPQKPVRMIHKPIIGMPITIYDPYSIMKPDNLDDNNPRTEITTLSKPLDVDGLNKVYK